MKQYELEQLIQDSNRIECLDRLLEIIEYIREHEEYFSELEKIRDETSI